MPPQLATLLCLLFIGRLFWLDISKRKGEAISWVPLAWMFLAGSRWVSSWLALGAPSSVDAYSEGSPVDRAVFLVLILAGMFVLSRRRIDWGRLVASNVVIVGYLLFCLSSVLWTDAPIILVKRWFKDLGNPIIALIILTEAQPYRAVGITLRRLSFLLLPLSMLFIRYYPELGRTYHADGSPMYTGIGHQKNDLGLMCLTTGLYFGWKLLQRRDGHEGAEEFDRYDFVLLAMVAWLLRLSNSQTSLACLVVALGILLIARFGVVAKKPSRLVPLLVVVGVSYFVLEKAVQFNEVIFALLGRDASLTDRTDLWDAVWALRGNPIVGTGFMTFWSGDRMATIWRELGAGINQAHNGYLEQFLNLGYVGVGFIVAIMVVTLFKIRSQFKRPEGAAGALLRLCFLVCAGLYNYTEASFYGINNMWVLFLVASIDVSAIAAMREHWAQSPAWVPARPRRPAMPVGLAPVNRGRNVPRQRHTVERNS